MKLDPLVGEIMDHVDPSPLAGFSKVFNHSFGVRFK